MDVLHACCSAERGSDLRKEKLCEMLPSERVPLAAVTYPWLLRTQRCNCFARKLTATQVCLQVNQVETRKKIVSYFVRFL